MKLCTPGDAGYSLIELMVVVCVIGILGGMSVFQYLAARPGLQADGAMRVVMSELNVAREIAVSQRRFVDVEFLGSSRIRVTRLDVPSGTTLLRDVSFEASLKYGFSEGAGDTPDGFGVESASPDKITFNSDGMVVDTSGAPVNRTVYVVAASSPESLRAVTILGSTGRVRGYRWYGGDRWRRV
jgi:prepilin-type N-terminal cleavage/methylation domain-containing protein